MSILAASYNLAIISIGLGDIQELFSLNATQLSLLASMILIGAMIGSLASGILSDRLGRVGILIVDMATFVFAGIFSATASSYLELMALRLIVGMGVGMDYVIVFAYIAEMYHASQTRGARMALVMFFANFGILAAYLTGTTFNYLYGVDGWRYAALSGALFSLIPIVMRVKLRETQLWKGLRFRSLRRIVRYAIKGHRKKDILKFSIPWFLYQISDQSLAIILPLILIPILGADVLNGSLGSVFIKLFTIPASLITIITIERIGRKVLQSAGFLLRGVLLLFVGIIIAYGIHVPAITIVLILGLAFFFGALGPDKTTVIMPAEKYDTEIRGTSQGMSEASGRLGGLIGIFGYSAFSLMINGGGMIFLAATCVAGGFITHFIIEETRGV